MFVNRGDVNFFEYGRLVQDNGNRNFTVFTCDPLYDEHEGKFLFAICDVDIDDSWINQSEVESFAGQSKEEDLIMYAVDLISYYGPENFGDAGEILDEYEIRNIMNNYDADFETEPWNY